MKNAAEAPSGHLPSSIIPGIQPFLDQPEDPAVGNAMLHELEHPLMGNCVVRVVSELGCGVNSQIVREFELLRAN
jgi:hypothetical protein